MRPRILLADDEADIVAPVRYTLETEGFDVDTVGDGEAALVAARATEIRRGHPRRHDARAPRHRRLPSASSRKHRADHHADGEGRRGRPGARARARRRRLRDEAVLGPRARQPHPRGAAPPGARAGSCRRARPDESAVGEIEIDLLAHQVTCAESTSGSHRRNSRCSCCWPGSPAVCSVAGRSWSTSGRPRTSEPPGPPTCTSRTCGGRSKPTRRIPGT